MTNYKRESDQIIFRARDALKKKFGKNIFNIIDQYPLFTCPQTMLRFNYIFTLLNSIHKVPGDICEFGTWKGATAVFMAKMLDELEPQSSRKIIVFDNFSGLPSPSEKDGANAMDQIGNYKGDLDNLEFIIDIFDLSHRITLIKGNANKTVKEYFNNKSYLLISLAYFDFDLYEPTICAWNAIKNSMSKSSLISFDEGLDEELWEGECKAVNEIIDELKASGREFCIESNNISRQPQLTLRLS